MLIGKCLQIAIEKGEQEDERKDAGARAKHEQIARISRRLRCSLGQGSDDDIDEQRPDDGAFQVNDRHKIDVSKREQSGNEKCAVFGRCKEEITRNRQANHRNADKNRIFIIN